MVEAAEEDEVVFNVPPSGEPAVGPDETKTAELVDDVPPVGASHLEPEPVIADLDAAKEVEPHAAELEVAPEPTETVAKVLRVAFLVFIHG